jgi:hypothetical protein
MNEREGVTVSEDQSTLGPVTTVQYYDSRDRSSPTRIAVEMLVPDDAVVYARHMGGDVYGVFHALRYGHLGTEGASRLEIRTEEDETVLIPGTIERSCPGEGGSECRLTLTPDVDRFEIIGSRAEVIAAGRRNAFLAKLSKGNL